MSQITKSPVPHLDTVPTLVRGVNSKGPFETFLALFLLHEFDSTVWRPGIAGRPLSELGHLEQETHFVIEGDRGTASVSMDQEIIDRVRGCIAEVLALDVEEVEATSSLITDLGAESLDLVELMYLLENEFRIRLSRSDVSISAQLGLPEEEVHHEEVLTPKALELLRARFPDAQELLQEGATLRQLAELLTVAEIARAVSVKLTPKD